MTIAQKLKIIQQVSGLSQEKLAKRLKVSFVSLNRWIGGRAVPRERAQASIDTLYRECTGLKTIHENVLESKKAVLLSRAKRSKNILKTIFGYPDIQDQFLLTLTYTSNSIEGSTLTEAETAAVIFDHVTLPDKTLIEQLEARNHQAALKYLFRHLSEDGRLNEALVLKLHGIMMNGIRDDAGFYRRHAVRIVGADIPTANYMKVPVLMEELLRGLRKTSRDILEEIAAFHAHFEQIHPFSDGNGRVGRLLMHAMLLKHNFPPAVIRPENKRAYYAALNTAQRNGELALLQDFLCDGVIEGWGIVGRK